MNGYEIFGVVMTFALIASLALGFKPIWDDLGKDKENKHKKA